MYIMSCYKDSELQFDSEMVLCIEEREDNFFTSDDASYNKKHDNVMFITWSGKYDTFCVKGKRQNAGKRDFAPYSFCLETDDLLIEFLRTMVSDNYINVTLYNYNNIYNDGCELDVYDYDYEFFEDNKEIDYELVAYDGICLSESSKNVRRMLSMLKNSYNIEK